MPLKKRQITSQKRCLTRHRQKRKWHRLFQLDIIRLFGQVAGAPFPYGRPFLCRTQLCHVTQFSVSYSPPLALSVPLVDMHPRRNPQRPQHDTYNTCHKTGLLFLTTLVTRVTTLIYRYDMGFEIIPQSNRIFHAQHPGIRHL